MKILAVSSLKVLYKKELWDFILPSVLSNMEPRTIFLDKLLTCSSIASCRSGSLKQGKALYSNVQCTRLLVGLHLREVRD